MSVPAGVTMRWREHARTAHTDVLVWRFHTAKPFSVHAPQGVSQIFEQQLRAAGWQQFEADTSNNVLSALGIIRSVAVDRRK